MLNNNNEEINKSNIENYIEKWNKNPFKYKERISFRYNYDVVQVNFKYLAGTTNYYLCLYSMETYEKITNFQVKTSYCADRVISMLSNDILCVGGNDTISLISIKDFEVILVFSIKPDYKITEICILPDFNILICMKNEDYLYEEDKEYLLHYKYNYSIDKIKNTKMHNMKKISSELVTKKDSNLTMAALNNNNVVTIVEKKYIQIRELNIMNIN